MNRDQVQSLYNALEARAKEMSGQPRSRVLDDLSDLKQVLQGYWQHIPGPVAPETREVLAAHGGEDLIRTRQRRSLRGRLA
jgi:hypothetical protein